MCVNDIILLLRVTVTSLPDLITVVSPRAELHRAVLLVEREELDVHRTRALVDGRRLPVYEAARAYRRLRHQRHLVVAIGAIHATVRLSTRPHRTTSDRSG